MRRFGILPLLVLTAASCAHSQARVAGPDPRLITQHKVAFQLGVSEFYNGDTITIREVRGTESQFRVGGTYLVRGHYRLTSQDHATLLFSLTAIEGAGIHPTDASSRVDVTRGEGDFSLTMEDKDTGYPHLTFYASDGGPIGGIYFGTADSVLAKKDWSYRR